MHLLTLLLSLAVIVDGQTGRPTDLTRLADELAQRDVVFLGELHDNDRGHQLQLEIVRALHQRRPDLVVSLEMFERDVQGSLDDYLAGKIDEPTFLKAARPWPNYREHYRPVVEYARRRGLDVIAANVPRKIASKVAREGRDALPGAPHAAERVRDDKDRYWKQFEQTMKAMAGRHGGHSGPEAIERMYLSQCLKDDTMAESITGYIEKSRPRRPLVVHLCGRFHSDHGLGTVVRVVERNPLLQVGVVSMVEAGSDEWPGDADAVRDLAHYVLVVPGKEQPAEQPAEHPEPQPKTRPKGKRVLV